MAYGFYQQQQPMYGGAMPDMLGQYKMPYQQPQMPMQPQPQPQNGMIWVQGEAGAKSFMVAPGMVAVLWDAEAQRIYIKSADASGMPSMRTLVWADAVAENQPQQNPVLDKLTAMEAMLAKLNARFEEVKTDE